MRSGHLLLVALLIGPLAAPHDGPDPIGSWRLSKKQVKDGTLHSLLGVHGAVEGEMKAFDLEGRLFDLLKIEKL